MISAGIGSDVIADDSILSSIMRVTRFLYIYIFIKRSSNYSKIFIYF